MQENIKIISIILAAGQSSRMKENSSKCLKKITNEETIIERLIRQQKNILNAKKVYISTGFQSEKYDYLKSDFIITVKNENYKNDKNINSCFLCLQKAFNDDHDFDYVLISEGDVIVSKEDTRVFYEVFQQNENKDYVFVEKYSQQNKSRIGCVNQNNKIYLREESSNDDRMTGVFLISKKTAKKLMNEQRKIIEKSGMNYYYFNSFLNCNNDFKKLYFNRSFTVNNKKEYEWAKINIKK
jgi:choline kinase